MPTASRVASACAARANPDLTRVTPEPILEAPGAVARRYEALGGTVRYHGKPDPGVYARCLDTLARLGVLRRERVIAVGDSIAHDVAGARAVGLATARARKPAGMRVTADLQ